MLYFEYIGKKFSEKSYSPKMSKKILLNRNSKQVPRNIMYILVILINFVAEYTVITNVNSKLYCSVSTAKVLKSIIDTIETEVKTIERQKKRKK